MIIVTPGHYASAVGAKNADNFTEYPETKEWARKLYQAIGDRAIYVGSQTLSRKVEAINELCKLNDVKVAIEVHFNAAKNAQGEFVGRGCETLYHPGSVRGKQLAELVQPILANHFPPSRGVKEGWYQRRKTNGPLYFLEKTACPAIIIEPEFIQFASKIQDCRTDCCDELAAMLMDL